MELPDGAENTYINIFFYNYDDSSDIIKQKLPGGPGVGTDGNSMPFSPMSTAFFERIGNQKTSDNLTLSSKMILYHETFHIMQYKAGNYYKTFEYSLINSWYVEATASWFGRKYSQISYQREDFYQVWNGQPALDFQPQVSMWGGLENKEYFSEISWSHGNHRYAMEVFFKFLVDFGYWDETEIFKSFYSGSQLLPQEYLNQNIPNLNSIYGLFAANYTSGLMFNDVDHLAINDMINWFYKYTCKPYLINCNPETNAPYQNQYVAQIDDKGTDDYVIPIEKNEAWSWTVIKINTSTTQTFNIDFQPDEVGNEGTPSKFVIYLANRENNIIKKVDFDGEITVKPNLDYFLVMVNTPNKFKGLETFNYKLKISPF